MHIRDPSSSSFIEASSIQLHLPLEGAGGMPCRRVQNPSSLKGGGALPRRTRLHQPALGSWPQLLQSAHHMCRPQQIGALSESACQHLPPSMPAIPPPTCNLTLSRTTMLTRDAPSARVRIACLLQVAPSRDPAPCTLKVPLTKSSSPAWRRRTLMLATN